MYYNYRTVGKVRATFTWHTSIIPNQDETIDIIQITQGRL